LQDELRRPLERRQRQLGADGPLEAHAGLADQPQPVTGMVDAGRVEAGRLQQDGACLRAYLAVGAAHDTAEGYRPLRIGDDQHIAGKAPLYSIQRDHDLAVHRPAHDNLTALYLAIVEAVQRLAVLQHDVVGDIHDIVYRAHARADEALLEPLRGLAYLNAGYQAGAVPGAQVRVGYLHRYLFFYRRPLGFIINLRQRNALPGEGGYLVSDADDREQVGAVWGDLQV